MIDNLIFADVSTGCSNPPQGEIGASNQNIHNFKLRISRSSCMSIKRTFIISCLQKQLRNRNLCFSHTSSYHGSPGEVKTVEVNPMDQSKVYVHTSLGSSIKVSLTPSTYSGFHPEISVWGGRGVAISRSMSLPPLPSAFSLGEEGITWFLVS